MLPFITWAEIIVKPYGRKAVTAWARLTQQEQLWLHCTNFYSLFTWTLSWQCSMVSCNVVYLSIFREIDYWKYIFKLCVSITYYLKIVHNVQRLNVLPIFNPFILLHTFIGVYCRVFSFTVQWGTWQTLPLQRSDLLTLQLFTVQNSISSTSNESSPDSRCTSTDFIWFSPFNCQPRYSDWHFNCFQGT